MRDAEQEKLEAKKLVLKALIEETIGAINEVYHLGLSKQEKEREIKEMTRWMEQRYK